MRLKEISEYKKKILQKLIDSDTIVKLLSNDSPNCLDIPITMTRDERIKLVFTKIFPYKYVPETTDKKTSFLTMTFAGITPVGNQFKAEKLVFYVIVHKDVVGMKGGDLRYDLILSELDGIFNGSREFGIGKLQFASMNEMEIMGNGFIVYYIAFSNMDFN